MSQKPKTKTKPSQSCCKMATRNQGIISETVVSGTHRHRFFKRPIMPQVSAVAPQILLAPTATENPMVPLNNTIEAAVKDAEVQTMYRESEAQTVPYSSNYVVPEGENPEVLLLKNLTYENGLPLGKKEIEMIEYARAKREMEISLPPFTDEASMILRKRLMEQQEMREFRLREQEIDIKREEKLEQLQRALNEREESNEFMASQRLEGVRLLKMEEREKQLQKIKNKRIKALRRLAHQRNVSDPVLSDGTGRDIITDYFDRGSSVYAPIRRDGRDFTTETNSYDVASRTVPLDNLGNILSLEYTIPKKYLDAGEQQPGAVNLSKTAPVGSAINMRHASSTGNVIRAAEPRLTSAAQRTVRNTKRDVEEMHQILLQKKRETQSQGRTLHHRPGTASSSGSPEDASHRLKSPVRDNTILSALLAKKPKGRPQTPDYTHDRLPINNSAIVNNMADVSASYDSYDMTRQKEELQAAVTLLQRLIRGRAVQNIMFEGKYRRRELIEELKVANEQQNNKAEKDADVVKQDIEKQLEREIQLRESTVDAVIGSASSQIYHTMALEKARVDIFEGLQDAANKAIIERRDLEAAEAGRRQRENMAYPGKNK